MSLSRHFTFLVLGTAAIARAQTTPPAEINRLDKFVVSAGPDAKTAFDLAQGTSVLAGDELRRLTTTTLGETLASTPGVNSTYYGPGASRPIIRGLGGDRVRVLDNGVGALDASSVSPDHNTALEPLFASRIEVLRGPSTLLYGSSAVGGAVNVIDNAIPDAAPDGHTHGAFEVRGGGAGNERTAVLSAGGGEHGLAFHVNALRQRTDDLQIPGVARIDADAPAVQPHGTLPGSATDTWSASGGTAFFWSAGHAGAAVSHYATTYGVPTGDDPATSIDMRQTRLDLAAEITQPFGVFRGAKARLGFGDYQHSELSGGTTVNTTFKNRAAEGRLELPHVAIGNLSGTIGLQAAHSDFTVVGDEVATPPSVTQSGALFALEDWKVHSGFSLQFGARLEGQAIRLGPVAPALPAVAGYAARSGERRTFTGVSTSLGAVFHPAKDWSMGVAVAYTERLPTTQEVYSNGPHGGTNAYEVGTNRLHDERSLGVDLSIRRRAGFATGSFSAFVNRFGSYIFEQQLPVSAIPRTNNPDGLTPYQFVARDAQFHGAEAELTFHLYEKDGRRVHLELMSDLVRAEQTSDHEPLPRIPPLRYGARLAYEDGRWTASLEARHAAAQHRLAPNETPTAGHTLVNLHLGYLLAARHESYELFARADNLGNVTAREHTSFLKDFAPLPGRGVSGGVRITF